ncbi:DNA methyltransferase [Pseudomonas citronellolis]|nr:DNA methyltransferase [Pseudomonas citronellolis]
MKNQNTISNSDARKISNLKIKDITTTITSPPYFDMKDYGSKNQIGFGQSYDQYLDDLKTVFKSIYDSTKDTGTLWIVIDTFKSDGRVVPLPFDLSAKLAEIGWLLQDVIIWKKDKTVPWSRNGFVQRKFEYILFLSKSNEFNYFKDRVKTYDTSHLKKWWVKYPERYNPKGKSLDEVWEYPIPTQGSWGDKYIRHFCPLPTDMIGNMIQLSSNEGDIVMDPFAGSGSVLSQAAYMGRRYIGVELNKNYIKMFEKHLEKTLNEGQKKYKEFSKQNKEQEEFERTILNLRALKYAKILYKSLKFSSSTAAKYIRAEITGKSEERHKLIKAKYTIIGSNSPKDTQKFIESLINTAPLSKFGIEPEFEHLNDIPDEFKNLSLYGYTETNTHCAIEVFSNNKTNKKIKIISSIFVDLKESDYD